MWNRREFLSALGGLVAAAQLDPASPLAPVEALPAEQVEKALSEFTIRIGAEVYDLLNFAAPLVTLPIIENGRGAFTDWDFAPGPRRVTMCATLGHQANKTLLTLADPAEVELNLGPAGVWKFKAFVTQILGDSVDLRVSGPIEVKQ